MRLLSPHVPRLVPLGPRDRRSGLSLTEVAVSSLLVSLLMVGSLASVGAAARSWGATAEATERHALARQLLDEAAALPYEDPNQTPGFGLESGESGVNRLNFDDVDDFRDFTDTPPKDRAGNILAGYNAWQRACDVVKLDDGSLNDVGDNATDKGLRRMTVTVTAPSGRSTTLTTIRSVSGGSLQPAGTAETVVNYVSVSLQAGNGVPVTGGTTLTNHASDQ